MDKRALKKHLPAEESLSVPCVCACVNVKLNGPILSCFFAILFDIMSYGVKYTFVEECRLYNHYFSMSKITRNIRNAEPIELFAGYICFMG